MPTTELVVAVRAGILGGGPFPADLAPLATLPPDAADDLLTELIDKLLHAAGARAVVLDAGTIRLNAVIDAVGDGGRRHVTARLIYPNRIVVPDARREWAERLIALTDQRDREIDIAPDVFDAEPAPTTLPRALPEATATATTAATRTAYARLDAPDRVAPAAAFELRVGLGQAPTIGVSGPALDVPETAFTLTVDVLADGFEVLGGASLSRTIEVTPDDPYPYDMIRLCAAADDKWSRERTVIAIYRIGARQLGYASRSITVADGPLGFVGAVGRASRDDDPWPFPPDHERAADVDLLVAPGNDAGGRRVVWYYRGVAGSGHIATDLPDEVPSDMRRLYSGIEARVGAADLRNYLLGVGRHICDAVPSDIWTMLHDVGTAKGGPPSVLLVTADPYVPWELAQVPEPWLPDVPSTFGAQAVIGRWPYVSPQGRMPAPPATIRLDQISVVSGAYAEGEQLAQAQAEAAELLARYQGHPVPAELQPLIDCLGGQPPSQAIHLAVHGRFDPTGNQDGVYLVDGKYLDPTSVEGVPSTPLRLAFLNACQLGQSRRLIGVYAGTAFALLRIGVGAVIAPVWKVDDLIARTIAESFYTAVFSGSSPAEFLRGQRCEVDADRAAGGTRLAYLYFGHPLLLAQWRCADSSTP